MLTLGQLSKPRSPILQLKKVRNNVIIINWVVKNWVVKPQMLIRSFVASAPHVGQLVLGGYIGRTWHRFCYCPKH
jgi:hypothetical protein